jgi:hypothetical protein
MPPTEDERIAQAIRKLRGVIVYYKDSDEASREAPDDGLVLPLNSPEVKIFCGEIIRAIREGEPFPPGVDRAALQTAAYAVKHNPAGFDRAGVGAIIDAAWQAFSACPHWAEKEKREKLLELLGRARSLLARHYAPPCSAQPATQGGAEQGTLEAAAAAVAALLAQGAGPKLPGGPPAEELQEACAEITTRAFGHGDLDRLCRIFEEYVVALEKA